MTTIRKNLRAVLMIISILAIIWLVENWSVMPGLLTLGFRIPVKEFVVFAAGFLAHLAIGKLNAETAKVEAAKAKGRARVESAKADEIEKRKASRVRAAKARSKAEVEAARAEAKAEAAES